MQHGLSRELDGKTSNGAQRVSPKQSNRLSSETIEQKRRRISLARMRLYEPERFAREVSREEARQNPLPPRPVQAVELPQLTAHGEHRLWSKIKRGEPDACWPWVGARSVFGHGRIKLDGKLYSPHRLVYELTHGPIENVRQAHGSVVRHTCDNPGCCNPAHLRLGTQRDNVADMHARGRAVQNLPPVEHRFKPTSAPAQGGVR